MAAPKNRTRVLRWFGIEKRIWKKNSEKQIETSGFRGGSELRQFYVRKSQQENHRKSQKRAGLDLFSCIFNFKPERFE